MLEVALVAHTEPVVALSVAGEALLLVVGEVAEVAASLEVAHTREEEAPLHRN